MYYNPRKLRMDLKERNEKSRANFAYCPIFSSRNISDCQKNADWKFMIWLWYSFFSILKKKDYIFIKMKKFKEYSVSQVSMLGPSPDWIVGVSGMELCLKNCSWAESRDLFLYPWDAGVDSGITYESPDEPTLPQQPITRQGLHTLKKYFWHPFCTARFITNAIVHSNGRSLSLFPANYSFHIHFIKNFTVEKLSCCTFDCIKTWRIHF